MKKEKFIVSIIEIMIGAALLICSIFELVDEFWSGMGTSLLIIGVIFLIRNIKYKTNEGYREKIDIETDSDADGIPDYYEDNMLCFNGVKLALDKINKVKGKKAIKVMLNAKSEEDIINFIELGARVVLTPFLDEIATSLAKKLGVF